MYTETPEQKEENRRLMRELYEKFYGTVNPIVAEIRRRTEEIEKAKRQKEDKSA